MEKLSLDDKMNTVILPQSQSIKINGRSVLLGKIISIDPKSIAAKQEVIQNVSDLLGSAKKLEIRFNEFFSNEQRYN